MKMKDITESIAVSSTNADSELGMRFQERSVDPQRIIGQIDGYDVSFEEIGSKYAVSLSVDRKVVGVLELAPRPARFAMKGAAQVTGTAIANDHKGKGLILKLYAFLVEKGITIVSDDVQSLGAIKMWSRLKDMAGVHVYAMQTVNGKTEFSDVEDGENGLMIADFDLYANDPTAEHDAVELEWTIRDLEMELSSATSEQRADIEDKIAMMKSELEHIKAQAGDPDSRAGKETMLVATKDSLNENIINELFDRTSEMVWIKQTSSRWEAEIKQHNLLVAFTLQHSGIWNVVFSVNSQLKRTGSGNQFDIFSAVITAISVFINENKSNISMVNFFAKREGEALNSPDIRDSRLTLYDRMTKRLTSQHGLGYKTYKYGRGQMYEIYIDNELNENISVVGTRRAQEAKAKCIEPGTEEWFQHWFSLPYLTRSEVEFLKEQIKYYKK